VKINLNQERPVCHFHIFFLKRLVELVDTCTCFNQWNVDYRGNTGGNVRHSSGYFYRKLYNGGNCSTIWQNTTHFYTIL